jgi:hypothetical protein
VRTAPRLAIVTTLAITLAIGCRNSSTPAETADAAAPEGGGGQDSATDPAAREFGGKMSDLINEVTERYRPLDYGYNEDLLKMLDQIDRHLSGEVTGPPPRFMPKLDADEEVAHFRETIRRWTAKSGRNLRAEVDKFQAMVAARKPGGKPFNPEFQRLFSEVFDDLIPIEVVELRERRNRSIHEKARPLLDGFREKCPDAVRENEAFLAKPPYGLTATEPSKSKP